MRIWDFRSDVENYNSLTLVDAKEWDRYRSCAFDGESLEEDWIPFAVKVIEDIKDSDFPRLSPGVPVFSQKALTLLQDIVRDNAEILRLRSRYGDYSIVNVTRVLDCMDYERSEFKRFSSSGRIMRFTKYAFIPEKVAGEHLFKITDLPRSHVFVSDEFKRRVEESGLVGYEFQPVWDSEASE